MTAPEHVTLNESGTMVVCSHFNVWPSDVEYTRADLCIRRDDPALLAVVDALAELVAWSEEYDVVSGKAVLRPHEHQSKPVTDARAALAAITERMGQK